MDEAALIAASRTSPDAFALLYDRTQPAVYRFAYSLAGNHTGAEDLTSECYRRALANLHRYEHRGKPFEAWLFTIVRNLARDRGRRRGREVPLLDHDEAVETPVTFAIEREERQVVVRTAVRRLPDVQRRVVVLRFGHEWSVRQVADEMGKSEAAVKQLTYRAVNRLREILVEAGYEHDG
ncbi:MAG: sigma-70 family RNA polymerase sigma factor [Dehalococcoidia bacterium]|nr:sigma-70 family RNA polymerase sigma factor [Dehalococcoidia bacterium]